MEVEIGEVGECGELGELNREGHEVEFQGSQRRRVGGDYSEPGMSEVLFRDRDKVSRASEEVIKSETIRFRFPPRLNDSSKPPSKVTLY